MNTTVDPTAVTTLPVSALTPSGLNPRKSFDPAKLNDLAESILAKGVLQNLVVRPCGETFEIAAGERRWRAVMALVEADKLEPTFELPVAVRELTDLELLEIAMSENVRRADMHPLEEADGYLSMVKLGENAESIATRTGAAQSSVQKRLKLAEGLCDTGRTLLLAGGLTLAQAQAFVIAPKKDQEAYFKGRSGFMGDPRQIKQALMDRRPPTDRAFFKLDAYTKQGGFIIPDLFGGNPNAGFFADHALFVECQKDAMQAKKESLEKKGKTVHLEFEGFYDSDVWRRYGDREGHTLLTLEKSGEVIVRENHGPPAPRKKEATTSKAAPDGLAATPLKNRKRLAFEDQALTRAAQSAVMHSGRLAKIITIAGACNANGLRFWKNDCSARYEEGYQDLAVKRELEEFSQALTKPLGLKDYETSRSNDLLDLPSCPKWQGARASKLFKYLKALPDDDLDVLFRAVAAAHVATVFDGEATATSDFLLAESGPDMHDFFTADTDYLASCKKAELGVIAEELKVGFDAGKKNADTVRHLAEQSGLKTWLPERLRLEPKAAPKKRGRPKKKIEPVAAEAIDGEVTP